MCRISHQKRVLKNETEPDSTQVPVGSFYPAGTAMETLLDDIILLDSF